MTFQDINDALDEVSQHPTDKKQLATLLEFGTLLTNEDTVIGSCLKYNILPGLWAHLDPESIVTKTPLPPSPSSNTDKSDRFQLSVRADAISLHEGDELIPFIKLTDVALSATLIMRDTATAINGPLLDDLVVSIGKMVLDPLVDPDHLSRLLDRFGNAVKCSTTNPSSNRPLPTGRLTQDQWEGMLHNIRDDVRPKNLCPKLDKRGDVSLPSARVHAVVCRLSSTVTVPFPNCVGNPSCTLRVLLEYYFRSLIHVMKKTGSKINAHDATTDITSVTGSLIGAAALAPLGPVGWVAGSFIGSSIGRKHSSIVARGMVGAAVFGPVGLVAGLCTGGGSAAMDDEGSTTEEQRRMEQTEIAGSTKAERVRETVENHFSSNKYEYAGSAGVAAGAAAGAVLGPVGIVAGAFAGSLSGRKIVDIVSDPKKVSDPNIVEERPHKLGDKLRRVITNGKSSRGVKAEESYKFGDFTRGLFS